MTSTESLSGINRAVSVHHALARIHRTLRHGAGPGALTLGATSALWVLVNGSPMRLSELAARENVSAPTMSRLVAALERDGMVIRTADPLDGRASLIQPTQAAIDLINGATSRRAQMMETALSRLDPDDRAAAERSITLLADALTDGIPACGDPP